MGTAKFTPGPWALSLEGAHNKTWRIRSEASPYTAIVTVHARVDKEQNAHLIAAAPELFDVVERLSEMFAMAGLPGISGSDDPIYSLVFDARAALAKARGEA